MAIRGILRRLGFRGEGRAAKYLKSSGYTLLKRNYRTPFGEVDIVAKKGDVVVFAEVKTRSSATFGQPNEAVDLSRMARYVRSANYYFAGRECDCTVRFDIIEVAGGHINHIENAFTADDVKPAF